MLAAVEVRRAGRLSSSRTHRTVCTCTCLPYAVLRRLSLTRGGSRYRKLFLKPALGQILLGDAEGAGGKVAGAAGALLQDDWKRDGRRLMKTVDVGLDQ